MENDNNIHLQIIRLFSGEANPDEKRNIQEWISRSAGNRKLYSDLREIWLSSGIQNNADNYHLEKAIGKFREQIEENKRITKTRRLTINLLKYAAVFVLLLAIPVAYYFGIRNSGQQTATTITCPFGDKSAIVLPDNSKVWLNSGSKLTFFSDFKQGGRKVFLEGEAYFSVSKDKKNPFRVKTSALNITVLGTRFNVKAYPDENTISTTLIEGSIDVSGNFGNALLKPEQKLQFDKGSRKMSIETLSDTSPETEWKDGRLVFRNESIGELAPKLERWFDVDIVFADEQVKQRRFTGILKRESILEVVSYFDFSKLVECKIQGNKIIIKSQQK